jgi:hypothetical protein
MCAEVFLKRAARRGCDSREGEGCGAVELAIVERAGRAVSEPVAVAPVAVAAESDRVACAPIAPAFPL